MSFIYEKEEGKVYEAGWFLAVDEPVERKTKQIAQEGATIAEDGAKYVAAGTAYPSNDSNAIGIVYEDVDVTSGDMPGSVVTKGVVYEDRLAITGQSYDAATVTSADNPSTEGWYEAEDDSYALSTDTVAVIGKKYYSDNAGATEVTDIEYGDDPSALGLYESDGSGNYTKSRDTQADGSKTYYEVTGVTRLSNDAKTALEALGFKFIESVPAVVRPY